MDLKLRFEGPPQYAIRASAVTGAAMARATARRLRKGPRLPSWNWAVELHTEILHAHLATAFALPDIAEMRLYLNSLTLASPALAKVGVTPERDGRVRGEWFMPHSAESAESSHQSSPPDPSGSERLPLTLLYLHGGGYSFYPKSHASLIAEIALATGCRTFALDYRLSPEHRFPAQLEDAGGAYRWLLDQGVNPRALIVGGDSAGGNLALSLLLWLRDQRLPQPGLTFALSPPTDFDAAAESGQGVTSLVSNSDFDWIDKEMLLRWAGWFCAESEHRHPYVSPAYADLRNLGPIYIQAGRAEVLFDSIAVFAARATQQGADVVLDSWAEMNHEFQLFGDYAPQSMAALARLGQVIAERVRGSNRQPMR